MVSTDNNEEDFKVELNGFDCFYVENWLPTKAPKIKGLIPWMDPEEVPLRIAIAGAHGARKTQLAKNVSQALDIPIICNVARSAHELGFKLNKQTTISSQMMIWIGQFYEQLQVGQFITDNCLLDSLAYCNVMAQRSAEELDANFLVALTNLTQELVQHEYSVLFYAPIGTLIKDGVRSVDKRFQSKIDSAVQRYLNDFEIEYVPLIGNLNAMTRQILGYLEGSGLLAWGG